MLWEGDSYVGEAACGRQTMVPTLVLWTPPSLTQPQCQKHQPQPTPAKGESNVSASAKKLIFR